MLQSNSRSIVFGIIAILLWCWSGVCFRKGSEVMGSSMVYLTLMAGCGSLTAFVFQILRGQSLSKMVCLPFKVMVAGFWGVALYTIMLAQAFGMAAESDIGQINLLNYLWPVWTVVLGILLLGSKPTVSLAVSGILLGLLGVGVSRGIDLYRHLPSNIIPHSFALLGGFLWALYVVLLRKWKVSEEEGGTAFHFAICSLMAGCLAFGSHAWQNIPPFSGAMLFWIVLGGVGPVGIAYSLYEISVKNGPVILIASLAYFIPIGSSLAIGLLFRESMNSGLILGAVLIAIGAWLVHRACNQVSSNRECDQSTC